MNIGTSKDHSQFSACTMVWLEIRDSGADLSVAGVERNLSRGEFEGEVQGTLTNRPSHLSHTFCNTIF